MKEITEQFVAKKYKLTDYLIHLSKAPESILNYEGDPPEGDIKDVFILLNKDNLDLINLFAIETKISYEECVDRSDRRKEITSHGYNLLSRFQYRTIKPVLEKYFHDLEFKEKFNKLLDE